MYDLCVIGAGPGGYVAAEQAAKEGLKVALVEREELGGVCLNSGCIPSKSLLHSAKLYREALEGQKFGLKLEGIGFDLSAAMDWKKKTIFQAREGVSFLMKNYGVEVLRGEGRILEPGRVAIAAEEIQARNIILATGSRAQRPGIPGVEEEHVRTSKEVLELERLPKRVAILGAGVIGMEFASFFSLLGIEVLVFEMLPEILPMADPEIAAQMRSAMPGVDFHLGSRVDSIQGQKISFRGPEGKAGEIEADLVLLATGRIPNLPDPGEMKSLRLDYSRQGIKVDEQMRTNLPGVYAIGDLTGLSMLAHSASRMAQVAVNHILGKKDRMRLDAIPWAIYTHPEMAGCGLTEAQAKERGYETLVSRYRYGGNGRHLAEGGGPGLCKLVADARTGRILGLQVLGPYATEQIFGVALMLETDMRVEELTQIVFPHPSLSEVMREAALKLNPGPGSRQTRRG